MSRFRNGQVPRNLLVEVGPYHWMPAATAARWKALVADIQKNEGVTMRITPGKNAYRDYEGQVFARNAACARGRCNDAAVPGTSSHGGEYQGRDSLAIDVDNWAVLGQSKWYAYCRKHGFEPGFFDWEPWHIIDWNPWTMPASSSGSSGNIRKLLKAEAMDFFNLQGKTGSHHMGTFAVYRSNSNGNLYARRITKAKFAKGDILTFDSDALPELKSIFGGNFIGL